MARFYFGQIIFAYIDDGNGRTKERLAVIICDDDECDLGSKLFVVAITKGIDHPCPDYHFVIHDKHARDPVTGLEFPCVVKCNWVREIEHKRVIRTLGCMPDDLLSAIVEAFDRIQADPGFDDWQ